MNLTIDIGNTLIKMAVFDGGEIVEKLLAEDRGDHAVRRAAENGKADLLFH